MLSVVPMYIYVVCYVVIRCSVRVLLGIQCVMLSLDSNSDFHQHWTWSGSGSYHCRCMIMWLNPNRMTLCSSAALYGCAVRNWLVWRRGSFMSFVRWHIAVDHVNAEVERCFSSKALPETVWDAYLPNCSCDWLQYYMHAHLKGLWDNTCITLKDVNNLLPLLWLYPRAVSSAGELAYLWGALGLVCSYRERRRPVNCVWFNWPLLPNMDVVRSRARSTSLQCREVWGYDLVWGFM